MRQVTVGALGLSWILGLSCGGTDLVLRGDHLGGSPGDRAVLGFSHPIPPGEDWVLQFAYLKNSAEEAVTLEEVSVIGRKGLGDVVAVRRIEIAPLPRAGIGAHRDWVPAGIYDTYPPVARVRPSSRCSTQALSPVSGYELEPGDSVRILVWFQALGVGTFRIDDHVVTYRLGDQLFEEPIPSGQSGSVREDGTPGQLAPDEKTCAQELGVMVLE